MTRAESPTLLRRTRTALARAFPGRYPAIPNAAAGAAWRWWVVGGLLLTVYVTVFLGADYMGVLMLLTGHAPTWSVEESTDVFQEVHSLLMNLGATVGAVVFSLFIVRTAGLSLADAGLDLPRSRPAWRRFGLTFIVASTAMFGDLLFGLKLPGGLGAFPPTRAWVYEFGASALAGVQEEVPLIALLVVLLRLVRVRWFWVIVAACGLRVVFHLYYGSQALLAISVWIPLIVLIYRRLGSLWAIVLAHSVHDLAAFAITWGRGLSGSSVLAASVVSALAILALGIPAVYGLGVGLAVVCRDLWHGFHEATPARHSTHRGPTRG